MRISLKVGATIYPLAGAAGVSERTHSSAADFELTPESAIQIDAYVRGEYSRAIDRGNLLNVLSFTTTRQFATPAAAQVWCLDYDATFPRSGILVFDCIAPGGAITRRQMVGSVVDPPRRRCIGATALLDYRVRGGEIESAAVVAPEPAAATAIINPTGDYNSVLYTAWDVGSEWNDISIAYATPVLSVTTTVAVVGYAITVTPGTLAQMVVSGFIGTKSHLNGTYARGATSLWWHPNGAYLGYFGSDFQIYETGGILRATADVSGSYPSDSTWTTDGLTVTSAVSSAAQVIAAVNASSAASDLVTASAVGAVIGAVAAVAATNLTGGTD